MIEDQDFEIIEGTEPSHSYEHWIKLQTDHVLRHSVESHNKNPEETFGWDAIRLLFRDCWHDTKSLVREKQYGKARRLCLFLALLLVKRAAWLHRLEVRYENDRS